VVWAAVNAAISSMAAAARPLWTYEWLFMNDLSRAAPLPAKWRRKISGDQVRGTPQYIALYTVRA
jgi:hypothetical protein